MGKSYSKPSGFAGRHSKYLSNGGVEVCLLSKKFSSAIPGKVSSL